jgi:hypothetical protein
MIILFLNLTLYLIITFPINTNIDQPCFNSSIDNLGFKDIKIGESLYELKKRHKLILDSESSWLEENDCRQLELTDGILATIFFKGDNKFETFRIQDSNEYTLFNGKPTCIRLHFYQEKLVIIEIRNVFGAMNGYSEVFKAEKCILTSENFNKINELKINGVKQTLHIKEYYEKSFVKNTLTLIYSHNNIEKSLNEIKNQKKYDF